MSHPPPSSPELSRRPAIDYHLRHENAHWIRRAFESTTPGLSFLTQRYQREWLRTDVMAGLAVAAYAVPQVVAYSAIVGVPPSVSLWTALVATLVYVVVGGSRVLSVGPESTIALLAGVEVARLAGGDPDRVVALAAVLSLIVGVWSLIFRMFRLGVVADLLSQPLLVGYLAGAAVLMVVGQLGKLFGVDVEGETIVEQVESFSAVVADFHLNTLIVGVVTLAAILIIHRISPKAPAALIGVVGATIAFAVLDLGAKGVKPVGGIGFALPRPEIPVLTWNETSSLIVAGLFVAVMAYSDNILVGRGFPAPALPGELPSDRAIDPNAELTALGVVHLAVGAIGGYPVSSSGSRTALAIASRARTQVYSLVVAFVILMTLLATGSVLDYLPQAALGAVVVYAATKLVDFKAFARLKRFGGRELSLALVTLVATIVYGILAGVGVAITLSLIDMGQRIARPSASVLGRVPGLAGMHDVSDYDDAETLPGLVIFRYDAPLFFANVSNLRQRVQQVIDEESKAYPDEPLRWFLFNVEAISQIDITAADGLSELYDELHAQGIHVGLVRLKQNLRQPLERAGFLDRIGEDMVFPTLPVAEEAYLDWVAEHHGDEPEVDEATTSTY